MIRISSSAVISDERKCLSISFTCKKGKYIVKNDQDLYRKHRSSKSTKIEQSSMTVETVFFPGGGGGGGGGGGS